MSGGFMNHLRGADNGDDVYLATALGNERPPSLGVVLKRPIHFLEDKAGVWTHSR